MFRRNRFPQGSLLPRRQGFDFMDWFFKWVFPVMFIGIFLWVLGMFIITGYLLYTGATNPELIGQFLGQIVGGVAQGFEAR